MKRYHLAILLITGIIVCRFFGSCKNRQIHYNLVYSDLNGQMKSHTHLDYTFEGDAVLSVVDEVRLDSCKVRQPAHFSLLLTNRGKLPLTIYDIDPGCDCVELLSEKRFILPSEASMEVKFVFTPETKGDVYREITLLSNAVNPVEMVRVLAFVE